MKNYYRVVVKNGRGRKTAQWARELRISAKANRVTFIAVNAEGLELKENALHVYVGQFEDIASITPAVMNLKYAELEVKKLTKAERADFYEEIGFSQKEIKMDIELQP